MDKSEVRHSPDDRHAVTGILCASAEDCSSLRNRTCVPQCRTPVAVLSAWLEAVSLRRSACPRQQDLVGGSFCCSHMLNAGSCAPVCWRPPAKRGCDVSTYEKPVTRRGWRRFLLTGDSLALVPLCHQNYDQNQGGC
jgi:hypothetical protein